MKTWVEYLNTKGQIPSPVVSVDGDTSPSPAIKPPPAVLKGKNWQAEIGSSAGKPASYEAQVGKDLGKGLGKTGDKNLVYEPKVATEADETKDDYPTFRGGQSSSVWKMDSQKFSAKTEGMSLSEFVKYVRGTLTVEVSDDVPKIHAHRTGDIMPDPVQAIRYASFMANANANLMEALVMEFKRADRLGDLTRLILKHDEAYREVAAVLADPDRGEWARSQINTMVSEMTSPPAEEEDKSIDGKKKKVVKKPVQDEPMVP